MGSLCSDNGFVNVLFDREAYIGVEAGGSRAQGMTIGLLKQANAHVRE